MDSASRPKEAGGFFGNVFDLVSLGTLLIGLLLIAWPR